MKNQLVQPGPQKVWGWPAVVNFIFGGAATGFFLLSVLTVKLYESGTNGPFQPGPYKLLAPILVVVGLLCLTIEAGRLSRGIYLLRNLSTSWISRETFAAIIFVPSTIIDWLHPHSGLLALSVLAAVVFVISQAYIIYRARGVTAWNVSIIPFVFTTSSFVTGGGILLSMKMSIFPRFLLLICIICLALNLIVWLFYLYWPHENTFREATEVLRRPKPLFVTIGIGHLLPFILLLWILLRPVAENLSEPSNIFIPMAAMAMIAGSAYQKIEIILRAGIQRGFSIEGGRAAIC